MRYIITAAMLACLVCSNAPAGQATLPAAGWVERAIIFPVELKVHAKLDTGAQTSSINAIEPEHFSRDGAPWIRFSLTNREGRTATVEGPVVRTATVKRHFGDSQDRPVIELDICVGNVRRTAEVSLIDRSGLNYQLLVGRNFLSGVLLVDSGNSYRLMPECAKN